MRNWFLPATILVLIAIIALGMIVNYNGPRVTVSGHVFHVTIADSDVLITRGLAGVDRINPDEGMLFIFPEIDGRSFWMKDMKFPLDIIWITNDTVTGLAPNLPIPIDSNYPIYSSPQPVNYVLEVNAGTIKQFNIKIGDQVEIIK